MKTSLILILALAIPQLLAAQVERNVKKLEAPPKAKLVEKADSSDLSIVEFPDKAAEFPGGMLAFSRYLSEKLIYPQEAIDNALQGNVYLSFVVETDGSISNVKIDLSLVHCFNEEAVRLIKNMPKWKPGEVNGKVRRTRSSLPISFKLP